MAKFRCIQCKKEFEEDANAVIKRCPSCFGRYLELVSGESGHVEDVSRAGFVIGQREGSTDVGLHHVVDIEDRKSVV